MVIDGVTIVHSWRSERMAKTIDGKWCATLKRTGILCDYECTHDYRCSHSHHQTPNTEIELITQIL